MEDYIKNTENLLVKAVERCCDVDDIGIIFSSGLDSTLIGVLASRFTKVRAYAVGLKDSHDIVFAEKIQSHVDFDVEIIEIEKEDVENSLKPILSAINEPNPLKVSVGIPFYIASKKASNDNLKIMLCGQGGDELFGGYNRYVETVSTKGYKELEKELKEDTAEIYEKQLNYDIKITGLNNIVLRFPYMDSDFVKYVSEIPAELKIYEVKDKPEFSCVDKSDNREFIRKYIQREVAQRLNIPDFILNRKKKAAQYGSGVNNILEKLARENNFKKIASDNRRKDYTRMYLESLM